MKKLLVVPLLLVLVLGLVGFGACSSNKTSSPALAKGAVGVVIVFALKDEVKASMDEEALKNHLAQLIVEYKKVPGLVEKTFFTNPENLDQGAFLVFKSLEDWEAYLKTDLYKTAVLDICKGEPDIEVYTITASLKDGVIL